MDQEVQEDLRLLLFQEGHSIQETLSPQPGLEHLLPQPGLESQEFQAGLEGLEGLEGQEGLGLLPLS